MRMHMHIRMCMCMYILLYYSGEIGYTHSLPLPALAENKDKNALNTPDHNPHYSL